MLKKAANSLSQRSVDYLRIERAIKFISKHYQQQLSLDNLSAEVNMSKFHFSRMFKDWAGVSPIQFQQFLTLEYCKQRLKESASLLETSLEAGLSGSGRLHDLFISIEAMSPGDYKKSGSGIEIRYGFSDSPFGTCLIARTDRGICHIGFIETDKSRALELLAADWPKARFIADQQVASEIAGRIFDSDQGQQKFNLLLRGTNLQVNVWKALIRLPFGELFSYQQIAGLAGNPKAHRAVASAVGRNPVAYLIPCHRVIAKSGMIHNYRWGNNRKKALLGWEAAKKANITLVAGTDRD